MGLVDILNGIQNGPRGGQQSPSTGSAGLSPNMMAVLGLLAYKALGSTGQPSANPAAPAPSGPGGSIGDLLRGGLGSLLGGGQSTSPGGSLGDLLSGGLGSLLAGGAAGSVLSGGLGDLLKQFQESGQEQVTKTWVGTGANQAISPGDLAKALGADQISKLMAQSGLSRGELLAGLSQHLPEVVNQLTPNGRLPTPQELSHLIS